MVRDDIRQLSGFIRDTMEADIAVELGDKIRTPLFARLGNPILYAQGADNPVDCSLEDFDQVSLVYCHYEDENGQPSTPFPVLNAGKNRLQDEEKVYRTPVYIVRVGNEYQMDGLAGYDAEEWFHNVNIRPQRSVKLSQFDVGLLRPTSPPSGELLMSPATFHLGGLAYPVAPLRTTDLIAAYEPASGKAVIVKIELDPTTSSFSYEAGTAFDYNPTQDSPSHLDYVANAAYPKTVDAERFHLGWVRVYNGVTQLLQSAIYYAQELFNKGDGGSGGVERGLIVTYEGNVVTDNGAVVRYNETTKTLFTLSEEVA